MIKSSFNHTIIQTIVLSAILTLIPASAVFAHTDGQHAGWMHPLTGLDHIVAMVAVGAWSAQLGGRALWLIPTVFVAFMAVGGLVGFALIDLPYTEAGVALSVLLLGLAIALDRHLPVLIAAPAIAIFGISHGYLHGYEMPAENNKILYMFGFLATTAILHITGLIVAHFAIKTRSGDIALKIAGALAVIYGVVLLS